MTTHTTVTRIGPLTIQRINSSQNSLAAGDVDDQPICDDGSILLSACQSFFGKEDHDPPPLQGNTDTNNNNDGVEAVGSPSQQDHSNKQQLSTALPNITLPECSSSNSHSRVLHSRARSMSPSLTTNTAAATDDLDLFYNCSPTYYNGGSEESDTTVMSNNWSTSYFETSDFNAQTWVDLVQETETIRYCGAGAAILTAVIIIHPLALIGAAATAAVGASAAWAVGRFHDLDTGYQIMNHDDFGMLFWEEPTNALFPVATTSSIDGDDSISNRSTTTTAAIATEGSQQIIQQNEEGLREAFLLEQEQVKLKQEAKQRKRTSSLDDAKESGDDVQETDQSVRRHQNQSQSPQQAQVEKKSQQTHHHVVEKKLQSISLQEPNRLIRVNSAPVKELSSSPSSRIKSRSSKQLHQQHGNREPPQQQLQQQHLLPPRQPNKPTALSTQQYLDSHYPPLEIRVVNQVQFDGLNTSEFFQVFFSDDAPYSMKDFQQKRGDVNIHYGPWKDVVQTLSSFQSGPVLPLPSNSTRERTLTFNTLTKSYFGPAYAKATKIQRATQLSKHLLVIENQTQLSEVPFSDRFKVLERWVVEAVKSGGGGKSDDGGGGGLYTCNLTVHAEVIMISPCKFEPQIRKKAAETFTSLTTGWCKLATKALEATKEQKRKRMRNEQQFFNDDEADAVVEDDASVARKRRINSMKSRGATESELFAKHQKKFQELDNLIFSHGDGGIEVMHSIQAGAHSAFAEVLESPDSDSSSRLLKLRDGTVVEVAGRRRRGTSPFSRIPKKMNRTLLRKISRVRKQSR